MQTFVTKNVVESYARTLYANYRAQLLSSGKQNCLPVWENASMFTKREFREEAKQLLS